MPTIARARTAAPSCPPADHGRLRPLRRAPAWTLGLGLAIVLCAVYLAVSPPSADLAAATYRSDLFARAGLTIWDDGWYAGHALPAYSLLSPALGAWIGLRLLLALSAVVGCALFGLVASQILPRRAAVASTLLFAFGFCAELPSGRVPYDLGVAVGLLAVLAFMRGPLAPALALSVLTSVASPVAGAFLALAGLAFAAAALISSRSSDVRRGLALCIVSLAPILLLALMFPEGGVEPFAPGAFWPELAAALAFAALLPQGNLSPRASLSLRVGAVLYALALIASFLLMTPVGGNAVRLGALFGAPLVVAALWGTWSASRLTLPRRALLLAVAPLLLYWQVATSIDDQVALAGDPTVQASYYAPLRSELLGLAHGLPIRVEVPLTGAHWESAYLPGGPISIARGWERQLDVRYGALFYGGSLAGARSLSATAYERWLARNAIAYVALPDARLDSAGRGEARLVESGLPYLRQVWRSTHWRLFEVRGATPLVQHPAQILQVGPDSFTLRAPKAGSYLVRLHWTPYWAPLSGGACVSRASDGFTEVHISKPGKVQVGIELSPLRLFEGGPRCAG